ncbi:MAG: hypothetical protein ABW219_15860 [Ilumatobacteraceae bacterium]
MHAPIADAVVDGPAHAVRSVRAGPGADAAATADAAPTPPTAAATIVTISATTRRRRPTVTRPPCRS